MPAVILVGALTCLLGISCRSREAFRGPIDAVFDAPSLALVLPTNETDAAVQEKTRAGVIAFSEFLVSKKSDCDLKILTDREALQEDLSASSLLVFGTPPGSLWLAKHLSELAVVIRPDRIEADKVYEGSDLRFMTAWPHPRNPESGVVIYTAQRAEDVLQQPTSLTADYLVARGETVLGAGNYICKDDGWSPPPPISPTS